MIAVIKEKDIPKEMCMKCGTGMLCRKCATTAVLKLLEMARDLHVHEMRYVTHMQILYPKSCSIH